MLSDPDARPRAISLDDPRTYASHDPSDMGSCIAGLPQQFSESIQLIENTSWPTLNPEAVSAIAVLGMGGSAIGGDLVRVYLAPSCPIPIVVVRDYSLSQFLDKRAVVFASSYSGNTEETLSAVNQARKRSCTIVALTAGGTLGDLARQYSWPWVRLPSGFAPRAALGYSFSAILLSLQSLHITADIKSDLTDLTTFLAGYGTSLQPDSPQAENRAKQVAQRLFNRTPIIYGSSGTMAVAASRWRAQLCENAKQYAIAGECPECNHNEVVGWESLAKSPQSWVTILLRDSDEHERTAKRFDILTELLKEKEMETISVQLSGRTALQRLFSSILLGDWVSYYLAILNAIDPMRIEAIDYLKSHMGTWSPEDR